MKVLALLCLAALAAPALASVRYNSACVYNCFKKEGWKPVCVSDGRSKTTGGLYPNTCVVKHCLTGLPKDYTWYKYLPLDCGSAVGCSLMGQMVDRCHQDWLGRGKENPLKAVDCECAVKPPKPDDGTCKDGENGCEHCRNDYLCLACLPGYRHNKGDCNKCHAKGCLKCDQTVTKCQKCSKSYVRVGDTCVRK